MAGSDDEPHSSCPAFPGRARLPPETLLLHRSSVNRQVWLGQHPTYKALLELGKAVKTCFLCRYLADEATRREVNDGLNVVET